MSAELIAEFRAGLANFYMSGPWEVVSDHPALSIACGGYRVVQTANQNNHRHFGPSERWLGIESYGAAEHIARCSPDNILALLAHIESLESRLTAAKEENERLRKALEPFAKYLGSGNFDIDNKGEPLPDDQGMGWVYLTVGDFRAAREALAIPTDRLSGGGEHG